MPDFDSGSAGYTVPTGWQVDSIEIWGPGGSTSGKYGGPNEGCDGASSGGYSFKSSGGPWPAGTVFAHSVGVAPSSVDADFSNTNHDSSATTVSTTGVSMTANGGGGGYLDFRGPAGTASGGDTNTSGSQGSATSNNAGGAGAAAPNGGGTAAGGAASTGTGTAGNGPGGGAGGGARNGSGNVGGFGRVRYNISVVAGDPVENGGVPNLPSGLLLLKMMGA